MQRLSVLQLQNMILAFCSHIITQKHKINSINVFPVPDKDTGSNLAATFVKVKMGLEKHKFDSFSALSATIQEITLYSAQGNSGLIFTGFLAGFFESAKKLNSLDLQDISRAFTAGAAKARLSIESPKNGTILNVMDDVAAKMGTLQAKSSVSLETFFQESFLEGQKSLEKTKKQMEVLKNSNVVDAGGLAFLILLESFQEYLSGKKLEIQEEKENIQVRTDSHAITVNRYEVVFIIKKSLMTPSQIKELLVPLGDSIDIIDINESIKVHIHTDQPGVVKEIASSLGDVVFLQLSDMKEEKVLELIKS
jgi:dihydroxyacetone kinase-like predicted kinase